MDPFAAKVHGVRWVDCEHQMPEVRPAREILIVAPDPSQHIPAQLLVAVLARKAAAVAHVRTLHFIPGAEGPMEADNTPGGLQVWFQFDTLQGPVGPQGVDPADESAVLAAFSEALAHYCAPTLLARVVHCTGLPAGGPSPTTVCCVLTVGDETHTTAPACCAGGNAAWPLENWDSVAAFHTRTPHLDRLRMVVREVDTGAVLGEVELPLTRLYISETKAVTPPLASRLAHSGGELVQSFGAKVRIACRAIAPPFPKRLHLAEEEPPVAAALAAQQQMVDAAADALLSPSRNTAQELQLLCDARYAAAVADIRNTFEVLDSEGRGCLTASQFRSYWADRGLPDPPLDADRLMRTWCLGGDSISKEQFYSMLLSHMKN